MFEESILQKLVVVGSWFSVFLSPVRVQRCTSGGSRYVLCLGNGDTRCLKVHSGFTFHSFTVNVHFFSSQPIFHPAEYAKISFEVIDGERKWLLYFTWSISSKNFWELLWRWRFLAIVWFYKTWNIVYKSYELSVLYCPWQLILHYMAQIIKIILFCFSWTKLSHTCFEWHKEKMMTNIYFFFCYELTFYLNLVNGFQLCTLCYITSGVEGQVARLNL